MIAPMKRLSILCLAADIETSLEALHDLGVLHVTPSDELTGATSQEAHQRLDEARTALETLNAHTHHHIGHSKAPTPPVDDVDSLIRKVCGLRQEYRHLEETLVSLRHKHHARLPYGNFDPKTVRDLAEHGVVVRLYHAKDLSVIDVPEGVLQHVLSTDKTGAYFVLIGEGDFSVDDAVEFRIPSKSLADIEMEIRTTRQSLHGLNGRLTALTYARNSVARVVDDCMDAVTYADVHDTMRRHGAVASLYGYCPEEELPAVQEASQKHGWGLLIEDPDEDDDVPTLLKFPRWVTPIKAVLQMLSILPGYHEADISGVFLIFFSIFFAILIGDAGYGLLFLAITLLARHKKPDAPAYPFVLFGILSTCTIVWGAITGNYFGIAPSALPSFLQGVQVPWLVGEASQDHVMTLCFLIGAIHLTIAHAWNILALAPDTKALAQLGWIGLVWSMYLFALNMVLAAPLPGFFLPLLIASLLLILLFMTPLSKMKKEWIHHAMFPLSIINCFVDVVSYIRLFAVGLASLSVAQSFNDMAMQLGWQKIWTLPIMALILLAGHGLNIILCALGILVHGVRLNTLEFSLHKELEWKGIPYQPFARKERSIAD